VLVVVLAGDGDFVRHVLVAVHLGVFVTARDHCHDQLLLLLVVVALPGFVEAELLLNQAKFFEARQVTRGS
jgi:hypothetical protein